MFAPSDRRLRLPPRRLDTLALVFALGWVGCGFIAASDDKGENGTPERSAAALQAALQSRDERSGEYLPNEGGRRSARMLDYLESRLDPETGEFDIDGLEAAWVHKRSMPSATEGATDAASQQSITGDFWVNLGPKSFKTSSGPMSGRIRTIAAVTADEIYVGAALGGVWKTSNRGGTWAPLTDFEKSLAMGSIAVDPDDSAIIYAATGELGGWGPTYGAGVLKSTDGGRTWALLGRSVFDRTRIGKILLDPRSISMPKTQRKVYVASLKGFYQSIDGGQTWKRLIDGGFSDAVFDAANADIVYAARWEGGIFKYTDGAAPPTTPLTDANGNLPTSRFGRINLAATMDPDTNKSVLFASMQDYVAADQLKGVWRSTDGGKHWDRLAGAPPSFGDGVFASPNRYEVEPNDAIAQADTLGVGQVIEGSIATAGDQDFITFTTIGDSSFTVEILADRAGSGLVPRMELFDAGNTLIRKANDGLPYPAGGASKDGRFSGWRLQAGTYYIRVSSADGSTGAYQVSISGLDLGCQCGYDQVIAVEPNNPNGLYMGAVAIFRSDDGGTNWTQILDHGGGNRIHTDVQTIEFSPGNPQAILVGSDGGIWESLDRGNTWISRNGDLSITQHYQGMALHPTDPDFMIVGTQDNGSLRYENGVWDKVSGSDGGYAAIKDKNTWYATEINLWVRKTSDNAATGLVAKVKGLERKAARFIAPMLISAENRDVLIGGGGKGNGQSPSVAVYRSDDGAENWSANSGDLPGGIISSLAFAPSDKNVYYAGNESGRIYRTTDAGNSAWTEVTGSGLPSRAIEALEVDPSNRDVVYAGFPGFSGGNLFRTTNAGATSVQWVDIGRMAANPSDRLPDCPVNAIAVDPNYSDTIFVGTDVGLFRTVDGGNHWTPFDAGLPNTAVFDIVVSTTAGPNGTMRVATHGRGVWELRTSNDACERAEVIVDGSYSGSTRGTASEGSTVCAPGTGSPDVWYEYTASCDGILRVDTCGSNFDTVVSVHDPVCPGTDMNETACNDDCVEPSCGGRASCTERSVTQGEVVLIRVSGYGGATGDYTLNVSCSVPNDVCDDAFQLGSNDSVTAGTRGAGWDNAPTCSGVDDTAPGVWYSVVGTGNTMTASTCGSGPGVHDTKLSVYCAGCAIKQCIAANDDGCGLQSQVSWCAAPGSIYSILVHGYQDQTGPFKLEITDDGTNCGPFYVNCNPGNDHCAGAEELPPVGLTASNTDADTDSTASCAPTSSDVWYRFEPRCHGFAEFNTCAGRGSLNDTVLSVLDACSGDELACNDDAPNNCPTSRSRLTVTHRPDMTLKIRAASYGSASTTGTFDLDVDVSVAQLAAPWPGLYVVEGQGAFEDHLLRIDVEEDSTADIGPLGLGDMSALAYAPGLGLLYGVNDGAGVEQMVTIDPATGAASPFGDPGFASIRGLAFDPNALVLYASDTASDQLIRIDPYSGKGTVVGPLGYTDVEALAYDPLTDTLYGSDIIADQLLTIDTATGMATAVGYFFGGFERVEGLTFDTVDRVLYGTDRVVATGEGRLIRIDTSTGVATKVGSVFGYLDPAGLTFVEGPPAARVNEFYDEQLPLSGGCPDYVVNNIAGVPPGLSIDELGRITGTPTAAGRYTISFDLDDHDLATPMISASTSLIVRPQNDECGTPEWVNDGSLTFDSSFASTDGPDEPMICDYSGYTQIGSDLWYCYEASCTGNLEVSTCNSSYDTKVAIYEGCGCPAQPPAKECNDDSCYQQASLTTSVTAGQEYLIRVGGYLGARGSGQLDLTCTGDSAGACCVQNGCISTTASDCANRGGTFNGIGSNCNLDSDGDGQIDSCDGCPFDPQKTDAGVCGCGTPERDLDSDTLPDCIDDDDDGDGYVDTVDCNDENPETHPSAPEVNDGLDNQCPGEPGWGLRDEISGTTGFFDPADKSKYSWPAQTYATTYEVVRSDDARFTTCDRNQTSNTYWIDTPTPLAGKAYYYLVRSYAPFVGSWGADSAGVERTQVCP